MGDELKFFSTCSAQASPTENITGFLECLSNTYETELLSRQQDLATGLDTFFLIYGGALVFFMQIGFAMLCAGSIRAKNCKNVILWNLLDSAGGGVAFWMFGYAFTFGGDNKELAKTFVGNNGFFLQNDDTIKFEFWFFQWAFASAVSSIVAGAIAERTQMKAYLAYSFFSVGFVYPVVAHALWSANGFLSPFASDPLWGSGALDLAGSGPVHLFGGASSLAAVLVLGPRIGRFHDRDGNLLDEPNDFAPHSVALQMLGTFALWFGWYGFNPASVLKTSSAATSAVAALVAVNTTLAACTGAVSAMLTSTFYDYWRTGVHTYDLTYTMNGCLTGLVAVTAGCATVDTWAAVIIGIVAGWAYILGSKLLVHFRIDDAVDAIPVHMFGGAWGVFATGLFSKPELIENAFGLTKHAGWFYNGSDATLLGLQCIEILFIFGWAFTVMFTFYNVLNYLGWFRVSALEEEVGMDISRHKGSAYDISEPDAGAINELRNSRHGSKKHNVAVQKEGSSDGNNEEVNA